MSSHPCYCQQIKHYTDKNQLYKDTAYLKNRIETIEKSDAFYDSLKNREYKTWISRTLARLVITNHTDDSAIPNQDVDIAQNYFGQYDGMIISKIDIVQANVFDQNDMSDNHWIDRFLNSLHAMTSRRQIDQNLMFKVGDKLNAYNMIVNEVLMRNLPYLSTAFFIVAPNPEAPGTVIVNVFTRDTWSISADLNWGSYPWIQVYDRNFIGTGNQLLIKYFPKYNDQFDGVEMGYSIDNFWGTFANVDLKVGVGGTYNSAMMYAAKPFLLPNDHFYGLSGGYSQGRESQMTLDTALLISQTNYGAWYGYSFRLDAKKGTNLFFTASANYIKYDKRPVTSQYYNPYYQQRTTAIVALGVARQNYFQGNMIYGFGKMEDIPYGFKLDLIGGLEWNEYWGRRYYFGSTISWGNMTKIGYLNVGAAAGSYFDDRLSKASQMTLASTLRYFSPLIRMGNFYYRQFLNASATYGINRLWGDRETLSFQDASKISGVRTDNLKMGTKRLAFSSESVLFTPIYFYNFRFAFNLWADFGWLGDDVDLFANPVYATAGLGVRIKNERLIFNSISIRFGFALRLPEGTGFNPFRLTSEDKINITGFTPTVPKPIEYR